MHMHFDLMKRKWMLLWALLLIGSKIQVAEGNDFVPPNVSFSSVTKLPFVEASHKISYGSDPLQYGLLWQAPSSQEKQPLIVLIHGGCWLNAFGVDHALPMASALAQSGFDVWALEYRRTGDEGGGWPGSFEDVQAGIKFVNQLPGHINHKEVILVGHSAGGHLALLAKQKHDSGTQPEIIKAIGLAAITDLSSYAAGQNSCQTAGPQFMGGTAEEKPDAYQAADPKVHGPYQQTVLLQGQADVIVPESQAKLDGAVAIKLASSGHFDWIHPKSQAFDMLLKLLIEEKSTEQDITEAK
ncbi:alpha/beta hydrolase family protein [Marinicella rhabdoformis]|uniref:alpha/beta hydrolase family protein n=1 Tax=Marinicella rhabdoformis TaxID=2580566 RepID=UPI0012AEC605|nr:alpha/beta hydrolase [Marinicella rhabdoformis]